MTPDELAKRGLRDLVPDRCSGVTFTFDPGTLYVSKYGSGHVVIGEDEFVLEDDRCEGPDGPEGSVHWIARMDASEIVALRDFLVGGSLPDLILAAEVRGMERAAEICDRRHAEYMMGKGRDPQKYQSAYSLAGDAIRSAAKELKP